METTEQQLRQKSTTVTTRRIGVRPAGDFVKYLGCDVCEIALTRGAKKCFYLLLLLRSKLATQTDAKSF